MPVRATSFVSVWVGSLPCKRTSEFGSELAAGPLMRATWPALGSGWSTGYSTAGLGWPTTGVMWFPSRGANNIWMPSWSPLRRSVLAGGSQMGLTLLRGPCLAVLRWTTRCPLPGSPFPISPGGPERIPLPPSPFPLLRRFLFRFSLRSGSSSTGLPLLPAMWPLWRMRPWRTKGRSLTPSGTWPSRNWRSSFLQSSFQRWGSSSPVLLPSLASWSSVRRPRRRRRRRLLLSTRFGIQSWRISEMWLFLLSRRKKRLRSRGSKSRSTPWRSMTVRGRSRWTSLPTFIVGLLAPSPTTVVW